MNSGENQFLWECKENQYSNYNRTKSSKVQLFWEGHKHVRYRPYGFEIYLVNVKTIRRMAEILVAFSEKLNFTRRMVH